MKTHNAIIVWLAIVLLTAGCASTKVTQRDEIVTGKIPRPDTIWVRDFVATPDGVPPESVLAEHDFEHSTPQTAKQVAFGREVGEEIATQLAARINEMGMHAERTPVEPKARINDIILRGYLVSIARGSAAERIAIGFGAGTSEMKVAMEGFQVTPQGLRKLGSGSTDSTGGKAPGADLGLVSLLATHNPAGLIISTGVKIYGEESGKATIKGRVKGTVDEIAAALKLRFQEEGWIY
jgi:hypothetical protein